MGYGIKILATQSAGLPCILRGKEDVFDEYIKKRVFAIEKVSDDLFRLSGWTIDFIGNCKTLFNISEIDDEDEGDFWDNIYTWRWKYCQLEWSEMEAIIEPLVKDYDDDERVEIVDTLKKLFEVVEISRTFKIC